MIYHDAVFENYEDYMDETQRRKVPQCLACSEFDACGGVYHAYATEFADSVVWPVLPQ